MTSPKEKARELFSTSKELSLDDIFHEWDYVHKRTAALIVDEIIEALNITTGHLTLSNIDIIEVTKDMDFWQQVRKEIEKL